MQNFLLAVTFCSAFTVNANNCGKSRQDALTRIIGGQEAIWKEFPWQVSIARFGRHVCGGAIINENWVVSAAHCFYVHAELKEFKVSAGIHDIHVDSAYKQTRSVIKLIKHPEFGRAGHRNDIALLEMETPFNLTSSRGHVGAVCLPKSDEEVQGNITISGWGKTTESALDESRLLQAVVVPITTDFNCQYQYFSLWNIVLGSKIDSKSMFCAGLLEGGKDSCQGDSGGPAVQYSGDRAYLKGIVSWGHGCARPRKPGVYTEVPFFVPWINYHIRGD